MMTLRWIFHGRLYRQGQWWNTALVWPALIAAALGFTGGGCAAFGGAAVGGNHPSTGQRAETTTERSARSAHNNQAADTAPPRNIILVLGDGMGPQQLGFATTYYARTRDPAMAPLQRFLDSAQIGMHLPLPARSLVNDSACAASQLVGGCDCEPQQIGVDSAGVPCSSVTEAARLRGMRVGVVSDTRLTDATPAAFYARSASRRAAPEIAQQLVDTPLDIAFSGGADQFLSRSATSATGFKSGDCYGRGWGTRADGRDLIELLQARGVRVACSRSELEHITSTPAVGLFAPKELANSFDEGRYDEPTSAQLTEKALQLLTNEGGFFLMVEAGQIDHAAHLNDGGWLLAELLRLSAILEQVTHFQATHPDTLVILTGDHETGGMGLSYRGSPEYLRDQPPGSPELDFLTTDTFSALRRQRAPIHHLLRTAESTSSPSSRAEAAPPLRQLAESEHVTRSELFHLQEVLQQHTGVTLPVEALTEPAEGAGRCRLPEEALRFYPSLKKRYAARIGRCIGAHQGVVWATGSHTSTPVVVAAAGPSASRVAGWHTAATIGRTLLTLLQP